MQTVAKSAPQLWEGEWAERFGRTPADPWGSGFGFVAEQLEAFQVPSLSVLRDYIEATRANALQHLRGLDDTTLENVRVASPIGGQLSLASVYQQMIWELNQHGGQIATYEVCRGASRTQRTLEPCLGRLGTPVKLSCCRWSRIGYRGSKSLTQPELWVYQHPWIQDAIEIEDAFGGP